MSQSFHTQMKSYDSYEDTYCMIFFKQKILHTTGGFTLARNHISDSYGKTLSA